MRGEADLGKVLDCFGLHEGVGERGAVGEEAVVGQENGVVVGDEGLKAGAYFFGTGGGIGRERNEAGGHENFRADGLIEGFAAGCERGGDGWMGVDDGLNVGPHAVDGDVHADLAGDVSGSAELVAVVVDDDHIDGAQEAFATACGCGEDEMFVETNGEVTGGTRSVAETMDPAAETSELPAEVGFGGVERRFEIGCFEVNRLLRHVLSHWIAALFWGFDSFLTFCPTTSEILNRRPAVRPPTTL
jgi:hypothetical protein